MLFITMKRTTSQADGPLLRQQMDLLIRYRQRITFEKKKNTSLITQHQNLITTWGISFPHVCIYILMSCISVTHWRVSHCHHRYEQIVRECEATSLFKKKVKLRWKLKQVGDSMEFEECQSSQPGTWLSSLVSFIWLSCLLQSDTNFTVLRSNILVILGELSNACHRLYVSC